MTTKKVAAAIIRSSDTILLTRRKPGEKLAGYWEFPGGKVEDGESLQQALEREIREELAIEITAGDVITSNTFTYDHGTWSEGPYVMEIIYGVSESPHLLTGILPTSNLEQ